MKLYLSLSILFLSLTSLATAVPSRDIKNCSNYRSFKVTGWKIHDPSSFKEHRDMVVKMVSAGRTDGSVIYDMSGPIEPRMTDTVDNRYVLLHATSWDNLKTEQDLMFGDYALLEMDNDKKELAEVRWFDGERRNIVINPNILKCFSEVAPYVENSIL